MNGGRRRRGAASGRASRRRAGRRGVRDGAADHTTGDRAGAGCSSAAAYSTSACSAALREHARVRLRGVMQDPDVVRPAHVGELRPAPDRRERALLEQASACSS